MRYLRILPAAASIIALTATIGFVRDVREDDEGNAFRIRIEMQNAETEAENCVSRPFSQGIRSDIKQVYRVEIEHGSKTKVVSIDALTGRIRDSAEIIG